MYPSCSTAGKCLAKTGGIDDRAKPLPVYYESDPLVTMTASHNLWLDCAKATLNQITDRRMERQKLIDVANAGKD